MSKFYKEAMKYARGQAYKWRNTIFRLNENQKTNFIKKQNEIRAVLKELDNDAKREFCPIAKNLAEILSTNLNIETSKLELALNNILREKYEDLFF